MHAADQDQRDETPPAAHWHNPLKDLDLDQLGRDAKRFELQRDMQFILALHNATLDDGAGLIGDALEHLRNPPQAQARLDDSDIEHGISLFLAFEHASESAFRFYYSYLMRCSHCNADYRTTTSRPRIW
ncbi:uncharacterized protein BJ212DRAFT_1314073 [Suillus subaureus]|uniref:Uncharacterized protein n=1 Tax=Suillus subaureus TaxID=48587 RepID=A0A9P7JIY2_9AGAM|nr:uncharacterized protein BJ212DRAFT_1314073 [Suillus subaureus]KAG1825447.1 hypothetical protein BJ212DRAFT_1314073 [Suillus subaureus]